MSDISDINLKGIHVLDLQIEYCYFLFQSGEMAVFIFITTLGGSMFVYILHLLEPHQKKK
jgi:hypothetical protein